jgi:hypothetical protein
MDKSNFFFIKFSQTFAEAGVNALGPLHFSILSKACCHRLQMVTLVGTKSLLFDDELTKPVHHRFIIGECLINHRSQEPNPA